MIKRRTFSLLFLAIIFGFGATWVANQWLQARMGSTAENEVANNTVPVVVAALEIAFGQPIEAAHIKTVTWPKDTVPEGVFQEAAAVEGRIATQRIFPGEPIFQSRAVERLQGSTLAAVIAPNKRAVTVRVNDVIGVAGFLLPGNRVDVLATHKVNRRALTETILEDLKVLAVDQTASPEKDRPIVVRAVTLEMDPEQAEKLVKATEEGSVQLALRNPLDKAEEKKKPVQTVSLRKTRPARRVASGVGSVTVIRGTSVDVTKVRM